MESIPCHDCRRPVEEDAVAWLTPADGRPDESGGEPFCPDCAAPVPLAA
ncbi:MAG: hypothetical protein AB7V62_09595 [Thermoleophilia bacterium]